MSVPENPGIRLENPRYRLSRLSVTVFAVLVVTGIAEGAAEYARRSPKIEQHVAGTNAITVHVRIAAAAAVISIQARRSRQPARQRGPSPWAAPFSAGAASRLRRTIRFAGGLSLPNLARAVAAVPLVLVLLYTPFRMGMQITGGLDPNAQAAGSSSSNSRGARRPARRRRRQRQGAGSCPSRRRAPPRPRSTPRP